MTQATGGVVQEYCLKMTKFCKRSKTKSHHDNQHKSMHHRPSNAATFLFNILFSTYLITLFNNQPVVNAQETSSLVRTQHDNKLSWEVAENAPNGTLVGRIFSNDGQSTSSLIIQGEPLSTENELRATFNFNLNTGDITTIGPLDRERRESYQFVAIFTEKFTEIKCTIKVKDVNDNHPYFVTNETEYVIEVMENVVARFQLPLVVDPDASPNAIREIRILSTNAPKGSFAAVGHDAPPRSSLGQNSNLGLSTEDSTSQFMSGIDPSLAQQFAQQEYSLMITQPAANVDGSQSSTSSGGNGGGGGGGGGSGGAGSNSAPNSDTPSRYQADLEVVRPLDRENQSSYQLVLEALDGGAPPRTTRLKVLVHVLDDNDNNPVFSSKLYKHSLREDTLKNTPILTVQAHDADLGSNGQISYFYKRHQSTTSQPSSSSSNVINTNSSDSNEVSTLSSGRLTATANSNNLNMNNKQRLQQQQQQQQIMAGNGKSFAQQRQSTGNSDSSSSSYENNSGPLMSNSLTQQELTFPYKTRQQASYPPDQYFDVDIDKGEIFLVRELDFETEQVHEFVIEARDHGKTARSSNTTVRITVLDVPDDPPMRQHEDGRRFGGSGGGGVGGGSNNLNGALGGAESSRADASAMARDNVDSLTQANFNFQNLNLTNWFAQVNSTLLFVIVLVVLFSVAFPVCLVKIKSRQPESDYNDTANLNPSNGATKSSPNHSANNIDHSGSQLDGLHSAYRHHDHHRHPSGPYSNGSTGPFGTPNGGKISRYPYIADSSNLYHNPYPSGQRSRHHSSTSHHMVAPDSPTEHQMAVGGSRGGTMNLHNHHHHLLAAAHTPPGHHSLDNHHHNHHQFANANHTTSSLTYAHHHSRAALLHQAHHHQSSHQLSSAHQAAIAAAAAAASASGTMNGANVVVGGGGGGSGSGGGHNKGGTMNSHHSQAHPASGSPIPATPNTTHSSGLPMNMHATLPSLPAGHQHHLQHHHQHHMQHGHHQHHHNHHQSSQQLPPTPGQTGATGSVFAWPPTTAQGPGSTIGCFPSSAGPPGSGNVVAGANPMPGGGGGGGGGTTPGSLDSCGTPGAVNLPSSAPGAGQPLDRWFDLGVSSQLVHAHDWCGSYNWDYLNDWTPEYTNLMQLIRQEAPGAF